MNKLRALIQDYAKWKVYEEYIDRIEAFKSSDFSSAVENAKSLIESISKEICKRKNQEISKSEDIQGLLKKAFLAIGYKGDDLVLQISRSLATIALQMGTLRSEIGTNSHGRTVEEMKFRNHKVDDLTREVLISTTEIIASFLIRSFELNSSGVGSRLESSVCDYEDGSDFNDYWDDLFGEFSMGEYAYTASEIFYSVDLQAYISESKSFRQGEDVKEKS